MQSKHKPVTALGAVSALNPRGSMQIVSDEPIPQDDLGFAREFIEQTMEDWHEAGNDPTALLIAMTEAVNEVVAAIGYPVQ